MFGQNHYTNSAIALSTALTLGVSVTLPAAAQSRFMDVDSSYWANPYVQALTAAEIISGFPDSTFRPDQEMTRAQFAAIVSGGFPKDAVRESVNFSDVPADHWAADAIASAYSSGFLSGYPDGSFGLNQPITRLEVLLSLVSGLGIDTINSDISALQAFADSEEIPGWAVEAIAAATTSDLVINYPNVRQLNPSRNATRAEIAAIAYQALVNEGRASAIASPYLPDTSVPIVTDPAEDDFTSLVASLGSADADVRKAAADQLAAEGAKAVPDLAIALQSDDTQTQEAAAYALNEIGAEAEAATPTLLEVLRDDDELVRALATSTLAQVGLDQGVLINLLTASITNESGLVKDIAADALVEIGGDAVPALGNLLQNEAINALTKQTAATLIGDINQANQIDDLVLQSAIPILTNTLNDGDSDVRRAAASALGDFGPLADAAIPALASAFTGEEPDVSKTIAASLTKIGQQSVPGLTEALNSENALTRLYAADALWTLTEDSSLILPTLVSTLSDGSVETRELAALGLTYLGRQASPALPDLRGLLGDDNDRIVDIAQLALLILGNRNEPAPDLGFLRTDADQVDSVPAIAEVVGRLWQRR
ncbi:S-layer homology domain-containing protein [cf. Phormidesmis sp. LEGE 11477]|uniref:HEAT repeat domain-containing protein n=1 Tax=cf. Phormidesmis sp. LEGE 11477 TaxID=1828680 RepID=UPI001882785F|nr:S-layer homology domain-containing protein [cf. Phormidesmis sp. LEGE 11477]MBE9061175.1 HEAT repeat domain-containing protein [cf. Phormidesmis sp. LEGE 11477]